MALVPVTRDRPDDNEFKQLWATNFQDLEHGPGTFGSLGDLLARLRKD